jgi:hypothetical protein
MLYPIILIIVVISFLLAFRSLKQLQKMEKVNEAKKELRRGKVVFQSDSSSASPDSSK